MRRLATVLVAMGLLAAGARAQLFAPARGESELRAAFAAWAAGEDEHALARLRALDEATSDDQRGALHRTKVRLARALARRQPQALLAAARLEQRAYLAYAAERRAVLALDTRLLVAELLQEYARDVRGDRATPAALLADLGAQLQANGQEAGAEYLFDQALGFDGRQRAARLGLAALLEKHGSYAPVVALLQDFPVADREAHLRLGVGLLRAGRAADGERELRALATDGTDWVRSLAAQELARLLVTGGNGEEALRLLRDAEAVLPCDPSLPVVASFVAERAAAQPQEAQPLDLAALGTCGEAAESARTRYTRPPQAERAPLEAQLAKSDDGWRAALRAALGPQVAT